MRSGAGFIMAAAGLAALCIVAVGGAHFRQADVLTGQHTARAAVPVDAPAPAPAGSPAKVPAPPALKAEHFLALTMYHEARGQSPEAMRAVGWVVLNRARNDAFPDGVHDVVVQPTRSGKCQFGWACGDLAKDPEEPAAWQQARMVAEELLFDAGQDPTRGAIWFWESWRARPAWLGKDVRETLELDGHSFYAPSDLG